MASWFSRPRKRTAVPTLRSQSVDVQTTKVDLADITPPPIQFLGRAAYVQLSIFENLSRAISTAPGTGYKATIGRVAELSLARHRALITELEREGSNPEEAMEPFTAAVDEFDRRIRGADWYEVVLAAYLTAGFLDDFYDRLAAGLPEAVRQRVTAIFTLPTGEDLLQERLREAIEQNPRLASRLAMWGRRLVGDTMLLARSSLDLHSLPSEEARVEPVFTDLIAAHSRRMDALGLTA